MPDILHRISIDASHKQVHDLVATPDEISWRVLERPDTWIGTVITFTLRPGAPT